MSKLVDLVRQQMKMMQTLTLTDAQLKSSKEQKCLKEEKSHMGGDWGCASGAARQQSCPAPPIAAVTE
eukprot:9601233-Ditylum_brightwellii.AAC.1